MILNEGEKGIPYNLQIYTFALIYANCKRQVIWFLKMFL